MRAGEHGAGGAVDQGPCDVLFLECTLVPALFRLQSHNFSRVLARSAPLHAGGVVGIRSRGGTSSADLFIILTLARAGGTCCVGWHMLNNFWLCGYTHAHATWPGSHTCTEPRCWRLRLTLTELSPLASVLRASQLQRRRPLKVSDARPPHTHYSALGTTRASALLPCPPPCSSPCSSSTAVVAAAAAAAARVLPSRPPPSRCRARQRQLATCAGSVW